MSDGIKATIQLDNPPNPIHIPWTKLSSSAIKLTTCRSRCPATEGCTVLWGCTKSGPEGRWLRDHEAGPAGGHCCASRRTENATGTATEWWCDGIIPSVVDGSELALHAGSCTVSSYRVQNKLCCFPYLITFHELYRWYDAGYINVLKTLKDEKGNLVAQPHHILARWRNHSLSYWMYMGLVMLGRQKHLQLSH